MNTWFNVGVKYTKQLVDGTLKRVSEKYLVNAIGFTEAEARIHQEVGEFVRGEFIVLTEKKEDFDRIIQHNEEHTEWYKCKVVFNTEDLDTGRQKKTTLNYLFSGTSIKEVSENIETYLKTQFTHHNFKTVKVELSNIIDVFPYKPSEE